MAASLAPRMYGAYRPAEAAGLAERGAVAERLACGRAAERQRPGTQSVNAGTSSAWWAYPTGPRPKGCAVSSPRRQRQPLHRQRPLWGVAGFATTGLGTGPGPWPPGGAGQALPAPRSPLPGSGIAAAAVVTVPSLTRVGP